jgi:Intracellular proteinase inhibitor
VWSASHPTGGLELRLAVVPAVPRAGAAVEWRFEVANRGSGPRRLTFPSGQQGDVVLSAGGAERYRWSRDKMFVMMLSERELAAGEQLDFVLEDVLEVEPGEYALEATVAARPQPPAVHGRVVVEPAA